MKKKKVSSRMIAFFSPKCNQTMLVFSKAARKAAIKGAIMCYKHEIGLGKHLIHEFKAVRPYLTDYDKDGTGAKPYFTLMMTGSDNYWQQEGVQTISINEFVQRVRAKYWRMFFRNDELFAKLTEQLKMDFTKRIHTDFCRYDFTEENIRRARLEMFENLQGGFPEHREDEN